MEAVMEMFFTYNKEQQDLETHLLGQFKSYAQQRSKPPSYWIVNKLIPFKGNTSWRTVNYTFGIHALLNCNKMEDSLIEVLFESVLCTHIFPKKINKSDYG